MTDRPDIKSEIIAIKGSLQRISPPQSLIKVRANKWLLPALVSAMTACVIIGLILSPDTTLKPKPAPTAIYAAEINPVTSPEITELKGQFVGLISGSIESKLKTLENSIRRGTISNSLGTIQDLKDDLKVLRAYSANPRTQEAPGISNEQLIKEVSHLRNLIYLTLASCGIVIAALASIWIKNRKRLPHPEKTVITHYLGK
jgi:hypothetical protein